MFKKSLLLFFVSLVFSIQSFGQCAMCRAVLESSEDNAQAEGINNGIVYLMMFPYLLIGAVFYIIYKRYVKAL